MLYKLNIFIHIYVLLVLQPGAYAFFWKHLTKLTPTLSSVVDRFGFSIGP